MPFEYSDQARPHDEVSSAKAMNREHTHHSVSLQQLPRASRAAWMLQCHHKDACFGFINLYFPPANLA